MFPGGGQQHYGVPSGFGQGQGWTQGPPGQAAGWGAQPGSGPAPYGSQAQYGSQAPPPYGSPAGAYHGGAPPTTQQYGGQQQQQQFAAGGYAGGYAGAPQYGYQPPPRQYVPPTPQLPPAPPGIAPDIWQWFVTVDTDRSGKITAEELRQALLNGNWTPFNQETCRLMIGMFDRDRSGTIDVYEFGALWKYIQDWKTCFDSFDRDRSGTIDSGELQNALRTFGYTLSQPFCQLCIRVFDRNNTTSIKFDNFIQCCVTLKTLTDQFRVRDTSLQGVIRISYEEFLEMVLNVGVGQGVA